MSVVMKGNVTVKVHGVLKQKQLPGTWVVLYEGGSHNIRHPYIELFDEQHAKSSVHTIVLENLKFLERSYRQGETFFVLSIKKEKHHFQCENTDDKEDWVHSLCHVSPDLWKQRASDKESSEMESDSITDMSENVLYDSFDRGPQFKVSINPNKASEANCLKGHYLLNPTKDSLRLLELDSGKSVHDWPYRQIRKFGCTRKIIKIEVGRRCSTGAGEFEFFTLDGVALTKLISQYIQQTFNQEHRHPQVDAASTSSVGSDNYVETSSDHTPQKVLAMPVPHQTSEITKDSKEKEPKQSVRGSTSSLDSKREAPKPLPRSSINRSRKEDGSSDNSVSETAHTSGDTKIYETASGLTAPLNSQLKHELCSKLHTQVSYPQETSSQGPHAEIEDDPFSDNSENSVGIRDSGEGIKNKKKAEKERKKLEKEQKAAEAKRKKQLDKEQKEREKELKEQKEKEAKEQKEQQKKLKKESKRHEKLKSKKSFDVPAPVPTKSASFSDGNIYDEPGELQQANPAPSEPADSGYCEASDIVPGLPKSPKPAIAEAAVNDVYATPQKSKNSWKTHGRPESEHIHQEDYDSIKQTAQSQPKSQQPPIPPYPSQGLPSADDVEDTYNHLGNFKPSVPPTENIYGMASAKDTIQTYQSSQPSAIADTIENEYEEAGAVSTCMNSKQEARQVRDEYEEADVPPRAAIRNRVSSAEVSFS